jgi:hypothetical protein
MTTKQDLLDVQELIQDDLLCLLDELPAEIKTLACQIVVDRMKPVIEKTDV